MKKVIFLLPLIFVMACGPDKPEYVERTVDEIQAQAVEYLDDTNWPAAAVEFTELERQHPESDLAARGMYMAGYAYYKGKKYEDAVDAIDHFLELHPAHENADYALYLKAMVYYAQISDVRREQHASLGALKTMLLLKNRFPNSPYTKNVEAKIQMLKNYLAGKEMFMARKLQKEDNYLAALKRFQLILQRFPETTMRPEALFRMAEIYFVLHQNQQVQVMQKLLESNHPDSEWTQKAKALSQ